MNLKLLGKMTALKNGAVKGICLFCFWTVILLAGCQDPRTIHFNDTTKQEVITSAAVGDSFPIYIALPADYYSNQEGSYDVLYLLDGDYYFNETQQMIASYVQNNELKPVILVGIGNTGQRARDYSPTAEVRYPGSGGSAKYASFITTELIPYIDSHYRTIANPENRCLAGHSLGGLFAYYTLFVGNDSFHKIIAASSTLMWDNGIIFQYEADYAASHTTLPVMFYTTVSSGDYTINPYQTEMFNRLQGRNYFGFTLASDSFEGEGHVYSWKPAFEKGLLLFFKK